MDACTEGSNIRSHIEVRCSKHREGRLLASTTRPLFARTLPRCLPLMRGQGPSSKALRAAATALQAGSKSSWAVGEVGCTWRRGRERRRGGDEGAAAQGGVDRGTG